MPSPQYSSKHFHKKKPLSTEEKIRRNPGLLKKMLATTKMDNPEKFITLVEEEKEEMEIKELEIFPENIEVTLESEKTIWKKKELKKPDLISLIALQLMYAKRFFNTFDIKEFSDWFFTNQGFFLKNKLILSSFSSAKKLVNTVEKNKTLIKEIIPFLIGWEWNRLSPIKQIILKLALTEINLKTQSTSSILNNAINQAKWFGEDKDYAFINSILDNLMTKKELWDHEN